MVGRESSIFGASVSARSRTASTSARAELEHLVGAAIQDASLQSRNKRGLSSSDSMGAHSEASRSERLSTLFSMELIDENELQEHSPQLDELREKVLRESEGGVVTHAVFAAHFEGGDVGLVAQIWKRFAVPVGPSKSMMIKVDDLCRSWQMFYDTSSTNARRLDFLCSLLDTDEDGRISRGEFVDFLAGAQQGVEVDVAHFRVAVDSIFAFMQDDSEGAGGGEDDLSYTQLRKVMSSLGLQHLFGGAAMNYESRPHREGRESAGSEMSSLSISAIKSSDETADVLFSRYSNLKKKDRVSLDDKGAVGVTCCLYRCRSLESCSYRSMEANAPRVTWLVLFFIGLLAHVVYKFWRYCGNGGAWGGDGQCKTELMGYGVCFARAGSQGTMWCVLCLLWPVCRGFLTRLRSNACCCCPRGWLGRIIPFDDRLLFHKVAAWSLVACTAVHVVAHLYNYSKYHVASDAAWNASCLAASGLGPRPDYSEVMLTLPGWTGHSMIIIMLGTIPLAMPSCRRKCFNVFWYSHQLLLIGFVPLFVAHGTAQWLEWSVTWAYVTPPLAIYLYERALRCLHPQRHVKVLDAQLLKGGVVVLVLRKPAFMHDFQAGMYVNLLVPVLSKYEWHPFTISSAPSDPLLTLHIREAGDWTRALSNHVLKCGELALTGDVNMEAVRTQGTYTNPMRIGALARAASSAKMLRRLSMMSSSGVGAEKREEEEVEDEEETAIAKFIEPVQLEGPFGAPTEAYREFQTVLLVGAGIGVTPFLSVIRDICNLWASHRVPSAIGEHIRKAQLALRKVALEKESDCEYLNAARIELEKGLKASLVTLYPNQFCVRKIYFHWLTRGQDSLQWFAQEISALAALDPESRIDLHMHLTRAGPSKFSRKLLKLAQVAARTKGVDAVSGIKGQKTNTHFGRPNWDNVFGPIAAAHPLSKVGVFFCGPDRLRKVLAETCVEWSNGTHRTRFVMHAEKF